MEKPIYDPPIPYTGPIYGGRFTPGKMVRIQGVAPGVAYRFDINLQCGPETIPRDDVAVQVSVRILDGYISLNSLQNGIWGEEQRGATLPIKRAEKFEIILLCDFGQYKVAINGQHYCEFPQRVHYDRISHLTIDGDVSIIQISYESASADGASGSRGDSMPVSAGAARVARFPVAPLETETDDFELIDSTTTRARAPPPGLHPAPPVGFSEPPSYDAVISNQGGPASQFNTPSAGAPYPNTGAPYPSTGAPYPNTGAPYPNTGAPYPNTGAPYPGVGPSMSPYPIQQPYPTGVPGVVGAYPPPGAPGIPGLPPGAPVPLNAVSSNFRPVKRSNTKKCCATCGGIILGILIVIAVVITKINRSITRHNNYDSYGNRKW